MTLSHNLPPLLKDIQTFVAGSVGELGSFGVSMRPSKVSQLKEELPGCPEDAVSWFFIIQQD